MRRVSLLTICLLMSFYAHGVVSLFESYNYGDQLSAHKVSAGHYDCSLSDQMVTLCRDDVSFAGSNFQLMLHFSGNELKVVELYAKYQKGLKESVFSALRDRLDLVAMVTNFSAFDTIAFMWRNKNSDMSKNLAGFERKAPGGGQIRYRFMEGARKYLGNVNDIHLLAKILPPSARIADVSIYSTVNDVMMMGIEFTVSSNFPPR